MDAHAATAPRRTYAARLTRAAIILAAALLLFFAIAYAVNSSKVASAARRLRDPDDAARAAAVKELAKMGPRASSAIPALLDLFRNDPSVEVRIALGDALWRIGPDTSAGVVWLRSKLDDPDPAVRTHAAFILGGDRPSPVLAYLNLQRPWVKTAVAALIPATRDRDGVVRWMAVTGIMRYSGSSTHEAIPALIQALGDEDSSIRDKAALALGRIGPPARAAVPALVAEVKRPYPPAGKDEESWLESARARAVKLSAAIALGRIGGPAVPELVGILRGPDAAIRDAALMGFAYAGAAPVPALVEMLRDPDAGIRNSAAQALSWCGNAAREAVPELARVLRDDKDAAVRSSAAKALPRVGGGVEATVAALASALKDENSEVTSSAVYALAGLGPGAKSALPALLEFVKDERRRDLQRYTALMVALELSPEAESSLPAHLVERVKETRKLFDEERRDDETRNVEEEVNPLYR